MEFSDHIDYIDAFKSGLITEEEVDLVQDHGEAGAGYVQDDDEVEEEYQEPVFSNKGNFKAFNPKLEPDADIFRLRWNDYESNVMESFRQLRADHDFFDVSFTTTDCGGRVLQAHKVTSKKNCGNLNTVGAGIPNMYRIHMVGVCSVFH